MVYGDLSTQRKRHWGRILDDQLIPWQSSTNVFPILFPSHNVCVQFILINFQVQLFRHQGEETALMETSSEMK